MEVLKLRVVVVVNIRRLCIEPVKSKKKKEQESLAREIVL